MSLVPTFRSLLLVCLVALSFFPLPSLAAHLHLFPPSALSASHHSHLSLVRRPTPRQLIKARQARRAPSAAVQAAHEALQRRVAVRELRRLRVEVEETEEEVKRVAERVRRAAGGAGARGKLEGYAGELHDHLFHLLQLLLDTQSSPSASSSTVALPADVVATYATTTSELLVHAAKPAAASASPVPSGRAKRRSEAVARRADSPAPSLLLHSTLLSLQHTLTTASSTLPYFSLRSQREAVEAVVRDIGEEAQVVVEGMEARLRCGAGNVADSTGLPVLTANSTSFSLPDFASLA